MQPSIKVFDDYHDIDAMVNRLSKTLRVKVQAVELGCFGPDGYGPPGLCEYWALFYSGRKPSAKTVRGLLQDLHPDCLQEALSHFK